MFGEPASTKAQEAPEPEWPGGGPRGSSAPNQLRSDSRLSSRGPALVQHLDDYLPA
jgi:hypothetical protein